MITYRKLAQNEIQFIAFCGITIFEFDLLEQAIRVEISRMRRGKERRPGGGRTPKLELREQMLVALNYMRTYTVQEAIAASFGIKQYDVSRIITKLSGPLIRCLPHPKKVFDMVKLAATMEEAEQLIPGLQVLVDASEQQTQRPKNNELQRKYYSGKAHRHTCKVQYTGVQDGLLLHKTQHFPGSVNDYSMYKQTRIDFPKLPRTSPETSREIRMYFDKGYQGVNKDYPSLDARLPIKKKPGGTLTADEKKYNRLISQIRIRIEHAISRVKRFRIMKETYRNPRRRYDMYNTIVCGLANFRVWWTRDRENKEQIVRDLFKLNTIR